MDDFAYTFSVFVLAIILSLAVSEVLGVLLMLWMIAVILLAVKR